MIITTTSYGDLLAIANEAKAKGDITCVRIVVGDNSNPQQGIKPWQFTLYYFASEFGMMVTVSLKSNDGPITPSSFSSDFPHAVQLADFLQYSG